MASVAVDEFGTDRERVVGPKMLLRALPVTNLLLHTGPNKWRLIWPLLYAVNTRLDINL